jgi:hypothetical protein
VLENREMRASVMAKVHLPFDNPSAAPRKREFANKQAEDGEA